MAAQFGMSATPVREAMLDLVKEGLVETVRNKGFRVVELADCGTRRLDRAAAADRGAERPPDRDPGTRPTTSTPSLRALAEEIERSAEAADMIAHNKADLEFHTRLLGVLGNSALVETVRSLRMRSRLYGQEQLANSGA